MYHTVFSTWLTSHSRRIKISHDPNNLAWSQSASYGQKILSAQGWTPGSFLGAKNARHASHYGTASASHIRINYKDDNLGLGAQSAGKLAEQSRHTDAFQGLLGRLNGRSEAEIQKEQRKGEDMRLALYAKGKWGGMEFVRGGILVQGKDFKQGIGQEEQENEGKTVTSVRDKDAGDKSEASSDRRKEEKKARREARRAQKEQLKALTQSSNGQSGSEQLSQPSHASTEEKRRRTEAKRAAKLENLNQASISGSQDTEPLLKTDDSMALPAKKKKKPKVSQAQVSPIPVAESLTPENSTHRPVQSTISLDNPITATRAPAPPLPHIGRHILRGRNIQSKRMAFQDVNGLDGIFMRQSQS